MHVPSPPPDQRPAETTAATGDQWVIGHGHQRAIVTEVGATLRSFSVSGPSRRRRLRPRPSGATAAGARCSRPGPTGSVTGPTGSATCRRRRRSTRSSHRNAIHGLVRWMPWRMTGRAQNLVGLRLRPAPLARLPLRPAPGVEYRLGRDGLTVTTDAENIGDADLPFGLGLPSVPDRRHEYRRPGPPAAARPVPPGHRRPRPADGVGVGGRQRVRLHRRTSRSGSPGSTPPTATSTGTPTAASGSTSTTLTGRRG